MAEEKLVLIDTDAGLDDALAILMALKAHRDPKIPFKVIGITCVAGNTEVDNVTMNVTRILEVMKATEIPIYRGAEVAMVVPYYQDPTRRHHGVDGMGDAYPRIEPKLEAENGVLTIIRLAHEYKGKLSILALGPLTNLAMAVRLDPSIKDCLKDIYLMGGNVDGVGNISPCAEFNFFVDPEAAAVTLSTYKCPIIVLPLEAASKRVIQTYVRHAMGPSHFINQYWKPDWRVNVLGAHNTVAADLINKIEANTLDNRWKAEKKWAAYDSTAIAAMIEPRVITKSVNHHCTVELHGGHSRGLMIVDYKQHINEPENVTVVTDMDEDLFRRMLIWAVDGHNSY